MYFKIIELILFKKAVLKIYPILGTTKNVFFGLRLSRPILDSERSEKTVDFTKRCMFFFLFLYLSRIASGELLESSIIDPAVSGRKS